MLNGDDRARRALAPDWHAAMLGEPCVGVGDAIAARFGPRLRTLAARLPMLHGFLLWRAASGYGAIALIRSSPGASVLLLAEAVRGRRRIVLLELIAPAEPRSTLRRALRRAWLRAVERPAMRRAVLAAHVLSEFEAERYPSLFGIEPGRVRHVPWAWCRDAAVPPPPARQGARAVVCSGRAYCDWETLFAAASDRDWNLTVVCGEADRDRVRKLSRGSVVQVLCEISRAEHDRLVRAADVYVLCLEDVGRSAGQVRLMSAVQSGVPVVASDVATMRGYIVGGRTGLVVPAGTAGALGAAVDRLLDDPREGERLAAAAFERARGWSYADFFAALRSLVSDAITAPPA